MVGVLIYRPDFAKNHYRKPHIIAIGYLLFAAASTAYLWYFLDQENKRRADLPHQRKLDVSGLIEDTEEERLRLGDHHITHKYIM